MERGGEEGEGGGVDGEEGEGEGGPRINNSVWDGRATTPATLSLFLCLGCVLSFLFLR